MKKTLETADFANDKETEDSTEGTSQEAIEESDLGPAEPSWKDLFQQNVDLSGNEEDPEDFSSPFSTDLITQVEEANNLVKRSTSYYNACKPNSVSLNRSTRQAFLSLVFGVLASVGVTTIFGGVTSSQIKLVQSDVNNLFSKQGIIVAQLAHNSKEILVNRAFSEGLKNLTVKLAKFVTAEHFITHGLVMSLSMPSSIRSLMPLTNTLILLKVHQTMIFTLQSYSAKEPFQSMSKFAVKLNFKVYVWVQS